MSVIVIRDGIIAADTGASFGDVLLKSNKLSKSDGVSIGIAGNWVQGRLFTEWYFNGADMSNLPAFNNTPGDKPAFVALVLKHDGSWEFWTEEFYRDTDMCEMNNYMAIGSGKEIALGALHMGASAVEAAEAACAASSSCSTPIEHYVTQPIHLVGNND